MLPSWLRQLFRQKFQGHGATSPFQYGYGLTVEALEDRALMAAATWTGGWTPQNPTQPDYTWGNPENWLNGYIPQAGDDVLFPAIPDGLAKPNAVLNPDLTVSFPANSVIDDDYEIGTLQIAGDNYHIDAGRIPATLTINGGVTANFAGTLGTITGLSLIGPLSTATSPNLRINLNGSVSIPGVGIVNQFASVNTGELYITATIADAPGKSVGILKTGTGTITLAGTNVYSGVNSVQSGILVGASDGAFGSSLNETRVSSGGTVGVSSGAISDAIQIIGTGAGGRGALRGLSDSLRTFRNFIPFGGGAVVGGVALTGPASIGADSALTDLAIDTRGISGSGPLTKVGFGDLALLVNSTYSGDTAISQGSVSIYTDEALAPGFKTTVASEATLRVDAGLEVNEALELTGNGQNRFDDAFNRPAGALSLLEAGTTTWLGTITLVATPTVNGGSIGAILDGTLVLAGALLGSSANGNTLTKVDQGNVRIARANSNYLGRTAVNHGTLEIANPAALGAGAITVNSNLANSAVGTLQVEGTFSLTQTLTLSGVGFENAGALHVVAPAGSNSLGASSLTLSGSVVLAASAAVNVDPLSTLTISGVVSDVPQSPPAEFNKLGDGTLILTANNTYTGQTVLRAGTTSVRSAGALGTAASGTSVVSGAVLSLDAPGGLTIANEALTLSGANSAATRSTLRVTAGASAWTGAVNFTDNLGAPVNVEVAAGTSLDLRGSLGGAATVHKVGGGTLAFTGAGANTNNGAFFVDAGTLALAKTSGNAISGPVTVGDGAGAGTDRLILGAANQLADNQPVTVNSTGLFDLNGFNETIGSATALTVAGGAVQTGAGTLTLNGNVSTSGSTATANVTGNVFMTATRTFLFRPTPQLEIRSSLNSSQFTNDVTFTVTATRVNGEPAPAGNITFYDGDTQIGSAQVLAPDPNDLTNRTVASITTNALSGGLHTIRAVYSGNNFYAPTMIVMAESQAVRNVPVYSALQSSDLTVEPLQNVTFTYHVTAPAGSQVAPTGTVTFFDNGVAIGTAQTLTVDGFAYVTKAFPIPTTPGERYHTITATYSGDLFFSSNTVTLSAPADAASPYTRPVTQQVGYEPRVSLTADNNAITGTRDVTLTFTAAGGDTQPTPAGTVEFFVDGISLNAILGLSGPIPLDSTGKAVLTVPESLTVGITGATWAAGTATITTNSPHGLAVGDTVTVAGINPGGYNGTFTITGVTANTFSYALVTNPGVPYVSGGTATITAVRGATWDSTTGTATLTLNSVPGTLNVGDTVTVTGVRSTGFPSGVGQGGFNGTFRVTAVVGNSFSYTLVAADPGAYTGGGNVTTRSLAGLQLLAIGEHEITAQFISSDATFTDALATLGVDETGTSHIDPVDNLQADTPFVSQFFSNKSSVRASSIGADDPFIVDPTSFTFRINTNDPRNFGASGDQQHPTPTGTVTFRYTDINGTVRTLGTVELGRTAAVGGGPSTPGQAGEATLTNVSFPRDLVPVPGTFTVTAIYSGDDYYPSVTETTTQAIVATNAQVRLSSSNSEAIVGEGVTYRVEVSTTAAGNVTTVAQTGNVVFTIRDSLGQVVVSSGTVPVINGVAQFTTFYGEADTYTVTAAFSGGVGGTVTFGAATLTLNQPVAALMDAIVVSSANPVPSGFDVTFTFRSVVGIFVDSTTTPTIPPAPLVPGVTTTTFTRGTAPAPTGTVTFFDGSNQIGVTQLLGTDGTASITVNNLPVGRRTIRAVYSGDDVYPSQTVILDEVQVVGTAPRVTVSTSANVVEAGDEVVVRVEAEGVSGLGLPTGRVTVYDGTSLIAADVILRNGVASIPTSILGPGRHTLRVEYSGDLVYAPVFVAMTQDVLVIDPVRFQVKTSANANVVGSTVNYPVAASQGVTYRAELVTGIGSDATGSVTFTVFDSNGVQVGLPVTVGLSTQFVTVGTVTTTIRFAQANFTAPAAVGNYRVVATYSGDRFYEPLTAEFVQPVVATLGDLPAAAPVATQVTRQQPLNTVSAAISGAAGAGLVSSGTGSLTLTGANTYSGTTLITGTGNVVTLGANNVLPDGTALTITGGTLNMNGKTDTVGSLEGTGNLQLPPGSALTTGLLNTNTDFTGVLSGSGTLNKVGAGALTLAGASPTYTGITDVFAGTVFLAADLGASNAIVESGATLGGTGVLNAVTVRAGGTLSPGGSVGITNSVGTVTGNGNLRLLAGSRFVVDVKGTTAGNATTGYDQYVLTGTAGVTLGGGTLVFNLAYTPTVGDSFTLIDVTGTGTITGTFAGLADNATFLLNNRVYQIHYTATQVTVTLIANASTATLVSSANPSAPGDSVTFTATITPGSAADPRPSLTGTVQFSVDGSPVGGPVSVVAGPGNSVIATFTTALPVGPHTITADYVANDANYQDRTLTLAQAVTVPSVTTLTAQQGPIVFGDNASFLAAVAQQSGLPVPTGTVTFTAGGVVLGTVALDGTGRAVLSSTAVPPGTVTVTATYSGDSFYRASVATATQVVDRQNRVVVGSDAGPVATVQVFDSRGGALLRTINPFDQYTLGVKVATGDVTGDGVADIVVSAGAGAPGGHVKVIDGVTFNEIASFFTFIGFNGGVNVAVGDVDGDGFGDVVIGTAVANDHVKAFSGRTLLSGQGIAADGTADPSTIQSFFAYSPSGGNTVGVTVGTGDVDGDGRVDIITGSATFAGHVKVFSGAGNGALIGSYFAYGAGYLGGINVAGGDLDGDGRAEVITGATNAPHVKALRLDGSEVASFFAFLNGDGSTPPFGARVGAADRNGDRLADILVGAGSGAPAVKVFSGLNPSQLIESFLATPPGQAPSSSGVFVGGSGPK